MPDLILDQAFKAKTTCHGTFVKIKEPELSGNKAGTSGTEKGGNAEKKPRKRPSKEEVQNSPSKKVNKPLNTLDNYFTGQSSSGSISVSGSDVNFVGGMVNSGSMDISNTKIFNSGNSNISSVGSVNFNNAKSMNSGNINITSHDIRNKLRSVWGNQMTSTSEPTIIELDSDFDGDNDDIEVIRRGGLSPRTMLRNVWGNK
ncbi:hypothetical protein WR25_11862 [Diploscapter pachys]|uniref:Uncharacterized protein n=1 Tax=Diploscapter pachys TaxID=2018661 RepID=A0A2A2L213_9BILA|nr:hypothetical protein WR25_11862 [Diploscapter pachys]